MTADTYYEWFYKEEGKREHPEWPEHLIVSPVPADTYKADIALLAWLHAELSWQHKIILSVLHPAIPLS